MAATSANPYVGQAGAPSQYTIITTASGNTYNVQTGQWSRPPTDADTADMQAQARAAQHGTETINPQPQPQSTYGAPVWRGGTGTVVLTPEQAQARAAANGGNANGPNNPTGNGAAQAPAAQPQQPATNPAVAAAANELTAGIQRGDQQYQDVSNYKPPVTAEQTFKPVTAPNVTAATAGYSGYNAQHGTAAQGIAAQGTATTGTATTGTAALASPGARLNAALQAQTTVQGTGLDTTEAEQSRQLQLQTLQGLQDTAAGGGAAGRLAQARIDAARVAAGQQANGIIQGARGTDRKGLRLQQLLHAGDENMQAAIAANTENAQNALTAQGQLVGATQGIRSTDVDVASKVADLQQQRNTLQAQLDSARAANDQSAINTINAKMADLDQQITLANQQAQNTQGLANQAALNTQGLANQQAQNTQGLTNQADRQAMELANVGAQNTQGLANQAAVNQAQQFDANASNNAQQFNATQRNDVATANANRNVGAQEATNQQGLAAQQAQVQQYIQQQGLKLQVSAQTQQTAQAILGEADKQRQMDLIQQQINNAKTAQDRSFWTGMLGTLITVGTTTIGALAGGPGGAAVGYAAGQAINNQALSAQGTTDAVYGGNNDVEPGVYAHGGLVTKPTHIIAGDAGPELIIPVKNVTARLAAALAHRNKPFDREDAPDLAALLSAATVKSRKSRRASA